MILRIITLLLLLTGPGITQAQDHPEYQDGKDEQNSPLPQQQSNGREQVRWPIPFNPSQEIGADSQVSFPTDI